MGGGPERIRASMYDGANVRKFCRIIGLEVANTVILRQGQMCAAAAAAAVPAEVGQGINTRRCRKDILALILRALSGVWQKRSKMKEVVEVAGRFAFSSPPHPGWSRAYFLGGTDE